MQEHQHVKTTPGEPVAPEIVPHAVRPEPGAMTQSEDINIPLVAVSVAFFAVFLVVIIVGLQAYVYNSRNSEELAKQVPQGTPGTELGDELAQYHHELYDPPGWNDHTGYGEAKKFRRIPIDDAMAATVKKYAGLQAKETALK